MKITLIGNSFDKNSGQGVYAYSCNIYENLKALSCDVEKIELGVPKKISSLFFKNIIKNSLRSIGKTCHYMVPELAFPVLFKRKSIVTFHDIIPYIIKERKRSFVFYFKIMCNIAKKAEKIVAVSESTKNDLIKFLKIPEEKIAVIYEGVDYNKFYPLKKEKSKGQFVVGYLGGLGKRKNVESLLQAAKILIKEKKIVFKIAGKGHELKSLIELKNKLKLKNVEFVGFVPDDKLNEFYNSLDVFVFPSFYEGFGLPIIEAMACGTPVITSNVSSMKELAKNVGILIDPKNPSEIAEQIKKLYQNTSLRKELAKKGIKKAKEFTWEKTAKELLNVYEGI